MARPKKTYNPEIGKRIKLIRNCLKMSQEEFAEKLDVSTQSISNWECGRKEPQNEYIERICNVLNISKEFILGIQDDPNYQRPNFSSFNESIKANKVVEQLHFMKAISNLGYNFDRIPNTNTQEAQDEISHIYQEIEDFIKFKYDSIFNKYNN